MNWKKLLSIGALTMFSASIATGQGTAPTIVQGDYISNVFGNSNFIKNPNAKLNNKDVTVSSATVTRSTTTPLVATSEFLVTTSTSTGSATWSTRTFDSGMKGQNCEARFTYRGFSVGSTTAQILQGANVVAQLTLTPSTDPRIASINFPCGDLSAATTFRLQQATASLTGTNEIGGIYVGLATNMANVAQAETVMIARRTTDQSIPNNTSTTILWNVEDKDVLDEYNSSTGVFTAKRAGTYFITSQTLLKQLSGWAAGETHELSIVKNTSSTVAENRWEIEVAPSGSPFLWNQVSAQVDLAVGDTIQLKMFQNNGATVDILGGGQYNRLQISRFPSSSELVVTPERQNVFAGVQVVNSAGSASNTVSSAAWAKLTSSAALTRTAYGKGKVETNNDFSITIENMPVGSYLVTASGTLQANSSTAAGLTECVFGLADSATGGAQIGSTSVNATGDTGVPTQYIGGQSFSGVYVNTSVANRTFFLQAYRGSGTGGCYAYTNTQRPFNITVIPLDQPSNSALYVEGPVKAAATGAAIPAGYVFNNFYGATYSGSYSNGNWLSLASTTLTPGLWQIEAVCSMRNNTTNATTGWRFAGVSISDNTTDQGSDANLHSYQYRQPSATIITEYDFVSAKRVIYTTTTILRYLNVYSTWTGGGAPTYSCQFFVMRLN